MPPSSGSSSFWERNLDKIGIGGAAFSALCCLGFPALLTLVSAAGLGIMMNDTVLLPLLAVSLLLTLWGLYSGTRHHHRWSALGIGAAGAFLVALSILLGNGVLIGIGIGIGIAALIIASLLNIRLRMRRASTG